MMSSRRYLEIDSPNFKTAVFFVILAVAALIGLALCVTFGVADIWGFTCGVLILLFGIGSGAAFTASATSLTLLDTDGVQALDNTVAQLAQANVNQLDTTGATASADGGSRLTPAQVKERFDLYEFVKGVCNGVVGESNWVELGVSKGDYRKLINYLAQLGIVSKRDGAPTKAQVPLPTAMRAIAVDQSDPDYYWAEVKEIYPMVHSQGQLIDNPYPVDERGASTPPLPDEEEGE